MPDAERSMAGTVTTLPAAIVVEIAWTEGSIPRTETYGPWLIDPDETWLFDRGDDHSAEIPAFLRRWQELTGCEPQRVVLSLVQDPDRALEDLRAGKASR